MLSNNTLISPKDNRPFRFLASWLLHAKFNSLVRDAWNGLLDVVTNAKGFMKSNQVRNKKVFGNSLA